MPSDNNGKSGTITPEEFTELSSYVTRYGAPVLASKVAKVCTKYSAPYKHEYTNSAIAAAWLSVAGKISGFIGNNRTVVSMEAFEFIESLVHTYGPEVVVQKLAKIAKRGNMAGSNLSTLFPTNRAA